MTQRDITEKAGAVLRAYGATEAFLFGSHARGDARDDSDIDIAARFVKLGGLFRYMRVKQELEDVLGKKVDLVQMEALDERLRASVQRDAVVVI